MTEREREEIERLLPDDPADSAGFFPTYRQWLPVASPEMNWEWDYLAHIGGALERVAADEADRLMIFVPPQHGKSQIGTIRFPVYMMERDPTLRVITGSYNQRLANGFSRASRRLAKSRGLHLSRDAQAVDRWELEEGGSYSAFGVGNGTGSPCDLLFIDDPVKGRLQANSPAFRQACIEWWEEVLYARLAPGAKVVLIMTRWHEEDLAGYLLEKMKSGEGDQWEVISLPAIAEEDNDPLGRAIGETFRRGRFTQEQIERKRRNTSAHAWASLYQQRPTAKEGDMFKPDSWPVVGPLAPDQPAIGRVRYWDLGGSDSLTADYSVGLLMARLRARKEAGAGAADEYVVEDVVRGRWSPAERNQKIVETAEADRATYGKGKVTTYIEKPPGLAVEVVDNIIGLLAGHTAKADKVNQDKVTRADPLASQAEVGNVKIVKAGWNKAFKGELKVFPNGRNDDQADGASGAFNKLSALKPTPAVAPQGTQRKCPWS